MSEINVQHAIGFITAAAQHIIAHRDELNKLDSALGDGDHGTGISTAFEETVKTIDALVNPSLSDVWKATASTVINRMGGASGALFGTFFLKGVTTTKGKETLSKTDMDTMFLAGLDGVKKRGKSDVGDKTMIDALSPAVEAFTSQSDWQDAWQQSALSARAGAESTQSMVAKHGRAKFIGERAIGHQDAGATTIALMFEAIQQYWEETQ